MAGRSNSGGLNGFLARQGREEQRRPASPSPATPRSRADAARFKVDNLQVAAAKVAPHPKISSTAPAPGYASNLSAQRNTFPGMQYQRRQTPPPVQSRSRELLDDTTVDEDFDKTLSDVHYDRELKGVEQVDLPERYINEDPDSPASQEYGEEDDEDYGDQVDPHQQYRGGYQGTAYNQGPPYREEFKNRPVLDPPTQVLHHKHSHSPLVDQPPQRQQTQPTGIIGRFAQTTIPMSKIQQDHKYGENAQTTKKRSRSSEVPQEEIHYDQNGHQYTEGRIQEEELPREREKDQHREIDEMNANGARTPRARAGPDNELQGSNQALNDHAQPKKPPGVTNPQDEKLLCMSYEEVENDSWELSPPTPEVTRGVAAATPTLTDRLKDVVKRTQVGGENAATMKFFMEMSTTDWEESGEWFIDRFSQIMQAMKANRQKRRTITEKFENEIRAREEVVRGKSENLDKTFKDMQTSGEGVLRGKV